MHSSSMRDSQDRNDLTAIREGRTSLSTIGNLLERHREQLKRLVALRLDHRVRKRVDDSDIVQEVMLEAAKRIQDYSRQEDPMPLTLWLRCLVMDRIGMCHRRHLKADRRAVAKERLSGRTDCNSAARSIAMQLTANVDSPSRQAVKAETFTHVRNALEELCETDREILILRHFEQLDNTETAIVMDLNPSTASSRYLRALAKLKCHLVRVPGLLDTSQ